MKLVGNLSRRSFLKRSSAGGLIAAGGGGLAMPALAQGDLPDPQSVLDRISIESYVREDYRELYGPDQRGQDVGSGQGLDPHRRLGEGPLRAERHDRPLRHRRRRRGGGGRGAGAVRGALGHHRGAGADPRRQLLRQGPHRVHLRQRELRRAAVLLALDGGLRGARLPRGAGRVRGQVEPAAGRLLRHVPAQLRVLQREDVRHPVRLRRADGPRAHRPDAGGAGRRGRPRADDPDL